jgi:hypothetical protein
MKYQEKWGWDSGFEDGHQDITGKDWVIATVSGQDEKERDGAEKVDG